MEGEVERRRALLAAADKERAEFRGLFQTEPLRDWELLEADSLEQARFMVQLDPCDVLLVDCGLYRVGAGSDWSWLAGQRRVPVLFLVPDEPETVGILPRHLMPYWLPCDLARHHPQVLSVMLKQAAEFGHLQRRGQKTSDALEDCRRQVTRLVNLLWEAVPGEGRVRWFTQRYMLERLEEEVSRARRYGGPLSVILGEVESPPASEAPGGKPTQATPWTVDRISRVKRRSDVAGQYGLQGFIMLLPNTDEAGAAGCCRRLRNILRQPDQTAESAGSPRVYFGLASFSPEATTLKSLLSRAEQRLENAKLNPVEIEF
jgi:GGDEF domain-containing protein